MQRGEIWWAYLPEPVGSGPGGRRPVLIIQSDSFNQSRINTVVVVIITSNLNLAKAPGNVLLQKTSSGLERDSVVNVSQIITVDKLMLNESVKLLSPKILAKVEEGVKLVLAIK